MTVRSAPTVVTCPTCLAPRGVPCQGEPHADRVAAAKAWIPPAAEPMILYAVVADLGVAHEAECVYSVWTTREGADAEVDRLVRKRGAGGCNVVEVEADTPADMWIG